MKIFKKSNHHLLAVLILHFFPATIIGQETTSSLCGRINVQDPFNSQPLKRMVLCKSQKLHFRTSLGLFPISSIDYAKKLLTIPHKSCSSFSHFVSPSLLSSGFPPPPQPNSIILLNCSNQQTPSSPFVQTCTYFDGCKAERSDLDIEKGIVGSPSSSCLIVEDNRNMEMGFDPKDLKCSGYSRVYRTEESDVDSTEGGFELGTRISFDIPPVHVPNLCGECERSSGHCGVGLRCICHPKECKDEVISRGSTVYPFGHVFFSLFPLILMVDSIQGLLLSSIKF